MRTTFGTITKFIIAALITVTSFSCISTRTMLIDVPLAARKDLPENIRSLTIVSQIDSSKYTDIKSDSLQRLFFKRRFNLDTLVNDYQMADTAMKALGDLLYESGRYDYVIPEARFLGAYQSAQAVPEIPWWKTEELCNTFQTDAVLSLDFLRTRVTATFNNETYFEPYLGDFSSVAVAGMKITYEALFRIYDPATKTILLYEFIKDTLYWEDDDISTRNLFSRFTPVKQALNEAGISIALDLTEKIAVRWQTEKRHLFTKGNSELREGNNLARYDDWEGAVEKWQNVAEKVSSKALKSKAEFNTALGYEMLGETDEAVEWALKSYYTMYRPVTYNYLETLKRRQNELKKIK